MLIPLEKLVPGVTPTCDALVYEVTSGSRSDISHTVDLAAWSGCGSCSCEHFGFHLAPLLREKLIPNATLECTHIQRARRYWAIECAQNVIRSRFGDNLEKYTQELPQG